MLTDLFFGPAVIDAVVGLPFDLGVASKTSDEAEMRALVAEAHERVGAAKAVASEAAELQVRIRAGQDPKTAAEREAAIERLEAIERGFATSRARLAAKAKEQRKAMVGVESHLLPLIDELAAVMDQVFVAYLAAIRDVRWELMAYHASQEDPTGEPALSSETDIRAFFGSFAGS